MSDAHQLVYAPLTAHAFSPDRSQVAVCPNTNEVVIYETRSWQPTVTLGEHDKLVTSLDWSPVTNQIVSCSQDRNAYVWSLTPDPQTGATTWKPTLVLLRLNRSATCVRWSPDGTKFAVGSGARTIAVCNYDEESNWWVAKHLKKPIRSTILDIDWHPNSVLLAAGSADSKARVFSAFLKGDAKPAPTAWGSKLPFNTVCGEFSSASGGWVNAVAFSPSGDALAFAAHDSTVTVVYPSGEGQPPAAVYSIRVPALPYNSLLFTTESQFVAAGHDCEPVLFVGDAQSGWSMSRSLDDPAQRGAGPARSVGSGRLDSEAFRTFRAADSRGVSSSGGAVSTSGGIKRTGGQSERTTVHQNTITSVRAHEGGENGREVSKVSTSGADGRLVIWTVGGGSGVAGVTSGVGRLGMR